MTEALKPAHRAALDVAIEDLDAAAQPTKSEVFTACGVHAADLRDAIKAALAICEEGPRAPAVAGEVEEAVERLTLDLTAIDDHANALRVRVYEEDTDNWSVRYLGDMSKDIRTILAALQRPAVEGEAEPVAGTYRVGDFIGRSPVLCEHGSIDPNNLCPLCEGDPSPPAVEANDATAAQYKQAVSDTNRMRDDGTIPARPVKETLNWSEIAQARGDIAADLGARLCLARMTIENAVDVLANRGRFGSADDALANLQSTLAALRSGAPIDVFTNSEPEEIGSNTLSDKGLSPVSTAEEITPAPPAKDVGEWVTVPRDPSRKLIEDLAHEWAYTVEEACESYQGFLDVVTKHGAAGSDPSAYEAASPSPVGPTAEIDALLSEFAQPQFMTTTSGPDGYSLQFQWPKSQPDGMERMNALLDAFVAVAKKVNGGSQ